MNDNSESKAMDALQEDVPYPNALRASYVKAAYPVLAELAEVCHQQCIHDGWYTDHETGKPKERNLGEMIALMHSELSEMMEGVRKGLKDDHLPHRESEEVELMDLIIRALDYAAYRELDFKALWEKFCYNQVREDHKLHNRAKDGGKTF